MEIRVVTAPYDAGHRGVRVGAGPEALVEGGLFDRLSSDGLDARLRVVELGGGSRHEVASAFELAGLISEGVRSSLNAGAFPLVLSGNCNGCVGTLGGLGGKDPGILWLDGRADFHTPETTTPVALRTAWGSPSPWGIAGEGWPRGFPASSRCRRRTRC